MSRVASCLFACIVPVLLTACDSGWPAGEREISDHFAEHRGDLETLASALQESEYVRVAIGYEETVREGDIYAEVYPGGRDQTRLLRDDDARRWRQLFIDARAPRVWADESGVVSIDVSHTVAGDDGVYWQTSYQLNSRSQHPACRADHRDAPCGRCSVELDESWSVFFEWMPDSLDMALTLEYVHGDMTPAAGRERFEAVFAACSAASGRTFDLPD
ncbi:MAG: hypothetical protein QNI99_16705 [Woeseiaceae bacterium]|nr:hypothetical protein [Woeseiaceae bacterium]